MGLTKDFLITIHNGGDEAVAAVQRMGDDWRAMLEQAATEIERRWIPVAERLPEPDYMGNAVGVLACLPDGEVCIGFCDNDEYGVRWQCNSTQKPTHWMPLPASPDMGSDRPNMGSKLGRK